MTHIITLFLVLLIVLKCTFVFVCVVLGKYITKSNFYFFLINNTVWFDDIRENFCGVRFGLLEIFKHKKHKKN